MKKCLLIGGACYWRFDCISCFFLYCRSPWSNTYDPPLDDGAVPSDRLRKLEVDANTAFDQYREM